MRDEVGFDLDAIIDTNQAYRKLTKNAIPDRRYLKAGDIQVDSDRDRESSGDPGRSDAGEILHASGTRKELAKVLEKLARTAWRRPAET